MGNSICSDTADGGSYSVYGATDDAMYSNVMGDGLEPSHVGNSICSDAICNSLKPSHTGDGICSRHGAQLLLQRRGQ